MIPLFLDNHLIALDKPAGLLTQPSGTDEDSLEAQAKAFLKETFNKEGNVFLEAVHRIDKPTFGVVLFARTSKALTRMNETMRGNLCQKTYRAILQGKPQKQQGVLEDWLLHDDFHAKVVRPNTRGAKPCSLDYHVIQPLPNNRTLVEVHLHSGRYHQIRAQFAHRNCPILGDDKYGAEPSSRPGMIALQHFCLVTPHPTLKTNITIQSQINLLNLFN